MEEEKIWKNAQWAWEEIYAWANSWASPGFRLWANVPIKDPCPSQWWGLKLVQLEREPHLTKLSQGVNTGFWALEWWCRNPEVPCGASRNPEIEAPQLQGEIPLNSRVMPWVGGDHSEKAVIHFSSRLTSLPMTSDWDLVTWLNW